VRLAGSSFANSCSEIQWEVKRRSLPRDNRYSSCTAVTCLTRPCVTGESTVIHPNGGRSSLKTVPSIRPLRPCLLLWRGCNEQNDGSRCYSHCRLHIHVLLFVWQAAANDSAHTADSTTGTCLCVSACLQVTSTRGTTEVDTTATAVESLLPLSKTRQSSVGTHWTTSTPIGHLTSSLPV